MTCLSFSGDGVHIASGGNEPIIKLWNADSGELVRNITFGGVVWDRLYL